MNEKGIVIPYEVADGIILAGLIDQRAYLTEELRANEEELSWLHPEDIVRNKKLIKAFTKIIHYYGGE